MQVLNIHEREISATASAVGGLINSLASEHDRLWPRTMWPPMRFDRPLGVGASGGHGPISYVVEEFVPGQKVRFRFTRPRGFHGHHWFEVIFAGEHRTLLRHTISMKVKGPAVLYWSLVIRSLHHSPARMPVHIQQSTNALNTALLFQIQDKILEFIGHARIIFSKSGDNLQNPLFRALNPGKTNMNEGRHLAHIQMPELPLFHVIIHRTQPLTFGTRKGKPTRMIDVDVYPLFSLFKFHLRYKPRAGDAKNLRKKGCLFHKLRQCVKRVFRVMNLETASEISGGLSGGLQVHHCQFTHKPVPIKRQEFNHNILGSPTQMCDAAFFSSASRRAWSVLILNLSSRIRTNRPNPLCACPVAPADGTGVLRALRFKTQKYN
jgi:hypothetical protein